MAVIEKLKSVPGKIRDWVKGLSTVGKAIAGTVLFIVLVLVIYSIWRAAREEPKPPSEHDRKHAPSDEEKDRLDDKAKDLDRETDKVKERDPWIDRQADETDDKKESLDERAAETDRILEQGPPQDDGSREPDPDASGWLSDQIRHLTRE